MPERRENSRSTVKQLVEVYDAESSQHLGKMVDLSVEGFMLLGSEAVRPGHAHAYELHLTETDHKLALKAECLWSRESSSPGKYWSGFHITDISREDHIILADLID